MFVRTARLTLRPGWPEDAAALTAAIAHESIVRNMTRVPWPYTLADAHWWLGNERPAGEVHLQIVAHEPGGVRLVGGTGLVIENGRVELGYWLTPDAWGRGQATEAAWAMIGIARWCLGVRRLHAVHHHDNPASGRVLRKLGFVETGTERRACLARGEEVDCISFTLAM